MSDRNVKAVRKQDNKGFTLIELLVAVMVLAIIITPLLNSFISSYRVNAKSRRVMRATALAQNEMEMFEKEKVEALMAMTEASTGNPVYTMAVPAPDADGCYTFKRTDVKNDAGDSEKFDVVITLNPKVQYEIVNQAPLMQMNTISNLDSGSFVQSIRSPGNAVDSDTAVYGIFDSLKEAGGVAAGYDIDRFEKELKRKITIHVTKEEESSKMVTRARVIYEYTLEAYGVMPQEYKTYKKETVIFDNADELDAFGNPIELKSVYLFYAPRYEANTIDEIVVENAAKLPVDFYIVRQDVWGKGTNVVQQPGTGYKADLSIVDGLNGANTYGRYWTNLNLDASADAALGYPVSMHLEDCDTHQKWNVAADVKARTDIKKLGQEEAKDRIYTMEVKVYTAGADTNTEAPIVRMTGSKIE